MCRVIRWSGMYCMHACIAVSAVLLSLLNGCEGIESFSLKDDKIVLSSDNYHYNSWPLLHLVNGLFDVRMANSVDSVPKDYDLVTYGVIHTQVSRFSKAGVALPKYVTDIVKISRTFNTKTHWKRWMNEIGLTDAMPLTKNSYVDPASLSFPIIMKTNSHGSRGVSVIHNLTEYKDISSIHNTKGDPFYLEEPLTYMGMGEIFSWGSAFQGKLLSLRCAKRTFKASEGADEATGIFMSGVVERTFNYAEDWLACGQDFVDTNARMVAAANLSGLFCSQIKLDSKGRYKILETNVRLCASQSWIDGLVLSTLVPFAFEVVEARDTPSSHLKHVLYDGTFSHIFHQIRDLERKMVATGGGLRGSKWVTASKLHPDDNIIDPIATYYNARTMFAGMKIVVAVAETSLVSALYKLKNLGDLFVFLSLEKHAIQDDVDLVISAHHANLTVALGGMNVQHLLPLQVSERSSERLGFSLNLHLLHKSREGNTSFAVFGAVHKGELLSARCVRYKHFDKRTTPQKVLCGVPTVQRIKTYFSEKGSDYSGAFCGELVEVGAPTGMKMQSSTFDLASVRGGLCPAVASSSELFVSSFVPLAVALRRPTNGSGSGNISVSWYVRRRPAIDTILASEAMTLRAIR